MDLFREYDIRGIINKGLDADFTFKLGKAYAAYLKRCINHPKAVSVGRDVRLSSESLATSLIEGIVSSGIDVYNLGVCPTPLQYFSLYHLDVDGGIMITGSHNPPEYNGFKLSVGKDTLYGERIQEIRHILMEAGFQNTSTKGTTFDYDIISAYREYIQNDFHHCKDMPFLPKVVIDAGNGTGGLIAPDLLKWMGCDVLELYCEPDGRFPNHHPDPTVVEYIEDLIEKVLQTDADIGIGYDGDADRIGIVDNRGKIIWGDRLMVLLGREILKEKKGGIVIGDVKCSQVMFDSIEAAGGRPVMWKTGHSLVKNKMRETGAVLAGEFSGHIFIADRYFGYDDAIYTTCRIIEILKKYGKGIRELIGDLPETVFTPEIRIDCPDESKKGVIERVQAAIESAVSSGLRTDIKECITIDGVRVVFDKGWALLRSSNTQPVLVMRAEAEDEQHLQIYKDFLTKRMEEQGVTL